jgi:CrcB protein
MLKSFLIVGAGGALGSMLRFAITRLFINESVHFPLATFLINLTGCFLIGLVVGMAERNEWMTAPVLLLLTTGFCGGFTTFSAFALENHFLLQKQFVSTALIYSALSLVLGVVVCRAGILLAK